MENSAYKKYAQGLLSVPEEKRIEEVEKLLTMLKRNDSELINKYFEAVARGETNITLKS